jgi:hypothetical protein
VLVFKHVLKGWWVYLFSTLPETAKAKAKICQACDKKEFGTYEEFLPDYSIKEVQGYKCGICKCPLSTLLRSEKKCKLGKF